MRSVASDAKRADWKSMNLTSAELDPTADEFDFAGIDKVASTVVAPPRVALCAAAFECELQHMIALGTGPGGANVVIGRIVWMHVSDLLIDQAGNFDASRLDTIGRMGGSEYVRTTDRFSLDRPPRPS